MSLKDQVVAALKTVYDPEMPIDIYDLGLIYEVSVDAAGINPAIRLIHRLRPTAPLRGACPPRSSAPSAPSPA